MGRLARVDHLVSPANTAAPPAHRQGPAAARAQVHAAGEKNTALPVFCRNEKRLPFLEVPAFRCSAGSAGSADTWPNTTSRCSGTNRTKEMACSVDWAVLHHLFTVAADGPTRPRAAAAPGGARHAVARPTGLGRDRSGSPQETAAFPCASRCRSAKD